MQAVFLFGPSQEDVHISITVCESMLNAQAFIGLNKNVVYDTVLDSPWILSASACKDFPLNHTKISCQYGHLDASKRQYLISDQFTPYILNAIKYSDRFALRSITFVIMSSIGDPVVCWPFRFTVASQAMVQLLNSLRSSDAHMRQ